MENPTAITSSASTLTQRLPNVWVMIRFLLAAGTVTVVHLSLVTTMVLLGLSIQPALAIAYVVSLIIHFTLNRQWVFASDDGYAFHLNAQGTRYISVAIVSYGLNAIGLAVLPALLGIPELAAFFLLTFGVGCVSFFVLRRWIFRAPPRPRTLPNE
jgi:putative flippase GtrA